MRHLIINADGYGFTPGISRAIEAHRIRHGSQSIGQCQLQMGGRSLPAGSKTSRPFRGLPYQSDRRATGHGA